LSLQTAQNSSNAKAYSAHQVAIKQLIPAAKHASGLKQPQEARVNKVRTLKGFVTKSQPLLGPQQAG